MSERGQRLWLDPLLRSELAHGFADNLSEISLASAPDEADFALVDGRGDNVLSELSHEAPYKRIVLASPGALTRLLLLYPKVIHGFVFSPVQARVVEALMRQDARETDSSGAVHRADTLEETGGIVLFKRNAEHPHQFACLSGVRPDLDLSSIENGEMLYQGYTIAFEEGQLVPLELGAGWIAYTRDKSVSNAVVQFAAGKQLGRRRGTEGSSSSEITPHSFIPGNVFDYVVRKEGSRSERFRRPYSVLYVHLPYDKKTMMAMAESILDLLRKSDSICEPEGSVLRIFCPETNYFDAFWLVHRIQDLLSKNFFSDSTVFGNLERPTFNFWSFPERQANQTDSQGYPRQLKQLLFPARKEFWHCFDTLFEKFQAYFEPLDTGHTTLADLLMLESALNTNASNNSVRISLHIGDTLRNLQQYLPVIRQKALRDIVETSGFVDGEPPGSVHALPFQSISDPRSAQLEFYILQSQAHTHMIGTYRTEDGNQAFFCDDPWVVDLLHTSFAHTYFLQSRLRR